MKRIFYVLVTLFTFVGSLANAQQIGINIDSGTGTIGSTVVVTLDAQYPSQSVHVNDVMGSLKLTDPSIAKIVGMSTNQYIDITLASLSRVNFESNFPFVAPQDISTDLVTLTLEITALGCTDIIFTDSPSTPISNAVDPKVVVDWVVYDDLATDFSITNGIVCGIVECPSPPINLDCDLVFDKDGDYQTLSWSPVVNAVSFEVEIAYNDPLCCKGVMGNFRRVRTNIGNLTSIDIPADGKCFSWTVRANCIDGSTSEWATRKCSCGPIGMGGPGPQGLIVSGIQQERNDELRLMNVPNPATNNVDITISGSLTPLDQGQAEMAIYDMSGKVVFQSQITLNVTERVDLSSFNSGVYIIKIINGDTLLSTERLIVE